MTCEEYDRFLQDPDNFRSWVDMENEEAERALRAQLEADRALAQSLLEEEQRAEAERVAAIERTARDEREKREREAREKEQKRLKELAKRRKAEEEASMKTVSKTTKPCPGCKAPIEKNQGW
jgi:cobalamin-dependent methionine synthase I